MMLFNCRIKVSIAALRHTTAKNLDTAMLCNGRGHVAGHCYAAGRTAA